MDEVQTGLGRTGSLFAFQRAGITPDVVVLSKAIGGGQPLAVIVYHRDLDLWKPGAHAGTFRGNQFGFAAGAATIRHIRLNRLDQHAENMGNRLMHALARIASAAPSLGDVRGRGLMIGVEVIDPDGKRRGFWASPTLPGNGSPDSTQLPPAWLNRGTRGQVRQRRQVSAALDRHRRPD